MAFRFRFPFIRAPKVSNRASRIQETPLVAGISLPGQRYITELLTNGNDRFEQHKLGKVGESVDVCMKLICLDGSQWKKLNFAPFLLILLLWLGALGFNYHDGGTPAVDR